MKENKYDNDIFFEKYSQMERSKKGLSGAGEWETLKALLPDFQGQRFWIWAAVMAGTVSMPSNMEQSVLQELIFPGRCWKKLKKKFFTTHRI